MRLPAGRGDGGAFFAVGIWDALPPVDRFSIGTPDYPDRSATRIVEVTALDPTNARLTGPGIPGAATLLVPDVTAQAANRAGFSAGVRQLFHPRRPDRRLAAPDPTGGAPKCVAVKGGPFLGALRIGTAAVEMETPELGFAVEIGEI